MRRVTLVVLMLFALLLLAACGAAGQAQAPAISSQAPDVANATPATPVSTVVLASPAPTLAEPTLTAIAPSTPAAAVAAAAPQAAPAATGALQLTLQPDSQVSFRVREQLADHNLPSDAVGTSNAVTGTIALQPDGKILPDQSKFVVDMNTLKTDSGMRDGYIRRNTLQTGTYPQAVFVPTSVDGLASPLPASGDVTFKVTGDMTIHGVTKPVTWDVQGKIAGQDLTGTATTSFKFEDFGMTPPSTMRVLSVEDNIKLEVAFHLKAQGS